jgi:hypothetical protein
VIPYTFDDGAKEKKKKSSKVKNCRKLVYFAFLLQVAMTANSLRVLALLAGLVVALPVVENLAVKRQVVQPAAERTGSFYRGAVESPPQIFQAGPGFQRSSVEYRPNPDFRPRNLLALKNFNSGVFLSQFYFPSLQVDHYRHLYPSYAPVVVLPAYVEDNLVIQKVFFFFFKFGNLKVFPD